MLRLLAFGLMCLGALTCCVPKPPLVTRCTDFNINTADASKIIIEYGEELMKKHRLFLYDSRVIYKGKIEKIRIDFTSMANDELCVARKVLVDVVEGYVKRFRDHATLNSKFWNRPITPKDFEIHITYRSYFNRYVDPEYVAYAILEDGWSYFYNSELNDPFTDYWMKKVEPYYQTRQFVGFKEEAEEQQAEEKEDINRKLFEEDRFFEDTKNNKLVG